MGSTYPSNAASEYADVALLTFLSDLWMAGRPAKLSLAAAAAAAWKDDLNDLVVMYVDGVILMFAAAPVGDCTVVAAGASVPVAVLFSVAALVIGVYSLQWEMTSVPIWLPRSKVKGAQCCRHQRCGYNHKSGQSL